MPEDFLTPEEEEEEELALQLAGQQELSLAQAEVGRLAQAGESYGRPSLAKYGFLFLIAGGIDLLDFLDVTLVGILFTKAISLLGTGLIYGTLWLTNDRVKSARQHGEQLEAALTEMSQTAARISRLAMRTSRVLKKVPGFKGVGRAIPRTMVKMRRAARKNPLMKIAIGGAINLIPFLAIVNLMVFWVYTSYRDEKKTLEQARQSSHDALEQAQAMMVELPKAA